MRITVHRTQLAELIAEYAKQTPEGDEALREGLAAWRRWMRKGYVLDMPGLPPVALETNEDWKLWTKARFIRLFRDR